MNRRDLFRSAVAGALFGLARHFPIPKLPEVVEEEPVDELCIYTETFDNYMVCSGVMIVTYSDGRTEIQETDWHYLKPKT